MLQITWPSHEILGPAFLDPRLSRLFPLDQRISAASGCEMCLLKANFAQNFIDNRPANSIQIIIKFKIHLGTSGATTGYLLHIWAFKTLMPFYFFLILDIFSSSCLDCSSSFLTIFCKFSIDPWAPIPIKSAISASSASAASTFSSGLPTSLLLT